MKKFSVTCTIIILMGCTGNMEEPYSYKEISFKAGGNSKTRTIGVIDSNDYNIVTRKVTDIQIIRGNDGDISVDPQFNIKPIVTDASVDSLGTSMNLTSTQYFMPGFLDARFIAYHPQADDHTAGVATFTIDGTKDIMVAAPQTASYDETKKINFLFQHLLACVVLNVKAVDEVSAEKYGKLISAHIVGPTKAKLQINADGSTNFNKVIGTNSNIHFTTTEREIAGNGSTMSLLVYPNDPGIKLLKITLAFENRPSEEYLIKTEDGDIGVPIEAGKKTYINVKVKASQISFEVSGENDEDVDVDPWQEDENNEDGKGTEVSVG